MSPGFRTVLPPRRNHWFPVLSALLAALLAGIVCAAPPPVSLVSVLPNGVQGNAFSGGSAITPDGRFVAFTSFATNLDPVGDTPNFSDLFVKDQTEGSIQRFRITTNGTAPNGNSQIRAISANGRYVSFVSAASNLVAGDTNDVVDVFVWDRETGTVRRASVAEDGSQANGINEGGAMSAEGRFVAFASVATNLVPEDTNGVSDIFVRDLLLGHTERVSVSSQDRQANGASTGGAGLFITADGRRVCFTSEATNLDPNDRNTFADAFMRDRLAKFTLIIGSGNQGATNGRVSLNAQRRVFESRSTNLLPGDTHETIQVYAYDHDTGEKIRVSSNENGEAANYPSFWPQVSLDGRYVAFSSYATNLTPEDRAEPFTLDLDVYLRDLQTGKITRLSRPLAPPTVPGDPSNPTTRASLSFGLSSNGRYAAFDALVDDIVAGDDNQAGDVLLYEGDPTLLLTFSDLNVAVASPTSARLSWLDYGSTGHEGYSIERVLLNQSGRYDEVARVGPTATGYTDTGLTPGTRYAYQIRSYSGSQFSEYSKRVPVTLPNPAPAGLTAVLETPSLALITWNNMEGETGYQLESVIGSGPFTVLTTLGPDVTSYRQEGLVGGNRYTYRVRALYGTVTSPPSNSQSVQPVALAPAAPTRLKAPVVTNRRVRLEWRDNSNNEAGFRVWRARKGSDAFLLLHTVATNTTFYADKTVKAQKRYVYFVTAFNSLGNSAKSNSVTVTARRR